MVTDNTLNFLNSQGIAYELSVDLKTKTWIRRGGIADIFITPKSASELENVAKYLYANNIKFQLLGHTSNVYILNTTNIPVVVSTRLCNKYEIQDDSIYCEAGASVITLSRNMLAYGIKGFEYLTGLPGTIGAALVNNSSCKTNSIADLLISAKVLLKHGEIKTYYPDDFGYAFRTSVLKRKEIEGTIISAILRLDYGDISNLQEIAKTNDEERAIILEGYKHNLGCTMNSCFINGSMPPILRLLLFVQTRFYRLIGFKEEIIKDRRKMLLCNLTGYKSIVPYVSSKNPIIFMWLDDRADQAFPKYLEFMRKVYKTDKVEIEII